MTRMMHPALLDLSTNHCLLAGDALNPGSPSPSASSSSPSLLAPSPSPSPSTPSPPPCYCHHRPSHPKPYLHRRCPPSPSCSPSSTPKSKENSRSPLFTTTATLLLARFCHPEHHDHRQLLLGTPAYVAPKILAHEGYDDAKFDIWSCDVILFLLMARYLPFHDQNIMAMY